MKVHFLKPGVTWNKKVEVLKEGGKVIIPEGYYGYSVDGKKVIIGTEFSVEELKNCFPRILERIQLENGKGYKKVALTKLGNWCPLYDGDIVIEE